MIDRQREREICKGYSSWKAIGMVREVLCTVVCDVSQHTAETSLIVTIV